MMNYVLCGLVVVCLLHSAITQVYQGQGPASLQVLTYSNGTYEVHVGPFVWLRSAPTYLHAKGKEHSTNTSTLKLTGPPQQSHGRDLHGKWVKVTYKYGFTDPSLKGNTWMLSLTAYPGKPFVIFEQFFPNDFNQTSTGDRDKVISSFPSFHVDDNGAGVLSYGQVFFWANTLQRWEPGMKRIKDGADGGVVVLFNGIGDTLVMSPYNNFMASSLYHDVSSDVINWGIMGRVGAVPAGYSSKFILYHSPDGINTAMEGWGRVLQRTYGKDRDSAREQDLTVNYLGYYTDNGAYYYNVTEPGLDYEDTILYVRKSALQQNVPYRYIQYDDWWYYVTPDGYGRALKWDARPSVFPNGLQYLYNHTKLPVLAHNRMWAAETPYSKLNGGKYDFLKSENKKLTLPLEQAFWDDLFSAALQWGLVVYEQDFLSDQFYDIPELHGDLYLGHNWLTQMGEAAARYGLRIQYCMALPRYVLHSLHTAAVTQIRVSADYVDSDQWKIGVSSMLAHAVGLAPWKDNFWTTSKEPGNKYNRTEVSPMLEAVVSLLSAGPVGPSDRLGYTNATILHMLCMSDGLLLKPSRPATAIDAQIYQSVWGGILGPQGEVYTTYSDVSGIYFGIILAAEMQASYTLTPQEARFPETVTDSVLYRFMGTDMTKTLPHFNLISPLLLTSNCTRVDFCLYYTAPVWDWSGTRVSLLGELDKVVPVSTKRIQSIDVGDDDIRINVSGVEGETIDIWFYVGTVFKKIPCAIGSQRTAMISLAAKTCY